ncbi:MAG: tol-pal system protein YbgF [Candidatus Acidiferrales bacterium]
MRLNLNNSLARILGVAAAFALLAAAVPAQKKEVLQLQRDVQLLTLAQRELQRSVDEKHAVLKTLIEQQMDATSKLNTAISGLQKSMEDVQANSGARIDTMSTQVQALADNFEEVKVRLGRMSQQLSDAQAVIQSLDAKVAGGAPPMSSGNGAAPAPGGGAAVSAPSAETLYSNALRDFTGGKYDLSRQEFEDYIRFFPESDLASNARFYIGEINYAEKKYAEAIRDYDQVLERYPRSFKLADARLKKALALLQIGQKSSAQRELREVISRHPGTEAERRARAALREISTPSGQ